MTTTLTTTELVARRDAARTAYGEAFKAFRAAYVELAAMDQLMRDRGDSSPGFGELVPSVVWFRHAAVNPDEGGSMSSDVRTIIERTTVEG